MSSIQEAIQENNHHKVSRLLLDSAMRNIPVLYSLQKDGEPEYVPVDRVLKRAMEDGEQAFNVVERGRQLCVKKRNEFSK